MFSQNSCAVEIPCYQVYETSTRWLFWTSCPRSPGHTPVIPKAAARGILDTRRMIRRVTRTAKKIAVAAVKAFHAEGIIVQQFSEAANGKVAFSVAHAAGEP
jgi:histidine triad (HIT) family protein